MNVLSVFKVCIVVSFSLVMTSIQAVSMPPVPLEPIYFESPIEAATKEIYLQNCVQLDSAIRYLHPYRYSYKPGFYADDANKLATTMIALDSIPIVKGGIFGLAYLGYSGLVEEKEQRRMLQIEQKIAMLQQIKAEKHCFE